MADPGRYHGIQSLSLGGVGSKFTLPSGFDTNVAVVTCEGAPFRFTVEDTDPIGIGHLVYPGTTLRLFGDAVHKFKAAGTGCLLQISYGWIESPPNTPFTLEPGAGTITPSGAALVSVEDTEERLTYRATFPVDGDAGIAVSISGSPTKLVKVTRVQFRQPAAAQEPLILRLYQGVYTNGTEGTTPTRVALDIGSPPASAVVKVFTVDPTTGVTSLGDLWNADVQTTEEVEVLFGDKDAETRPVTLHGVEDHLAIVLGADSVIDGYIEWTESEV